MHRNEDWRDEGEDEIKTLLPFLKSAFSGIENAAAALRAEDLGFDRSTVFWPIVFSKETTYGMAWSDDPDLVARIGPPPDPSPVWKLDSQYGDRVRYWNGEEWDLVAAPAPGNLDLYKHIAAGEDLNEVPEAVTIYPANSKEPDPLLETLKAASGAPRDTEETDDSPEPKVPPADAPIRGSKEEEVSAADLEMVREIARFIAERAFEFDDHKPRAWLPTDFEVWSTLAGETAQLSFEGAGGDESSDSDTGSS